MWENEKYEYEVRDNFYATVTGGCSKGVFLELDNGETAFAYFGGVEEGDRVLCTILRKGDNDRHTLVSIDSVIEIDRIAA